MDRIGQIGDFTFRLCCPEEIAPPENFRKFLKKEETGGGLPAAGSRAAAPDFTYRIKIADALPRPEGKVLARRSDLAVFQTKSGESRLIGVKGRERPYAYYEETGEGCAEITLGEGGTARSSHRSRLHLSLCPGTADDLPGQPDPPLCLCGLPGEGNPVLCTF